MKFAFAFADVVAETSSHGDMENVDGRLTVVVAFDAGFQLHDKACWRWIERWLLLDPSRIHLTLLHVARAKHVEAHLELTSYRSLLEPRRLFSIPTVRCVEEFEEEKISKQ